MSADTTWERQFDELRDAQRLLAESRWNRILRVADMTGSPICWRKKVKVDDYMTVTLGTWGGYLIQVMPMLFNDRLVMTPQAAPMGYDYGWCFRKGGAAGLAALAWNPQAQAEPGGFVKRINLGPRRIAGQKAVGYTATD